MAVITNQDDDANKKIKSSDRRKRAAAACGRSAAKRCAKQWPEAGTALKPP